MLGSVSIVSWVFLAGLLTAAVGSWAGWRVLHRRHHRTLAWPALAVAVVLSSATLATLVNRHFSYLPHVDDVVSVVDGGRNWSDYSAVVAASARDESQPHPAGVVVRLAVPDQGSGFGSTNALAYLPPQYFTDGARRFPVTYLFHGAPGVPADWFRGGQAAAVGRRLAQAGHPVIIVAPRMSTGWLDDPECVDGVKEKVETHFLLDVVPAVDAAFRTVATRSGRSVGGMSAGGFCALNLGLRNRRLISGIIDMSGDTRPTHDHGLAPLFGTGPAAARAARANDPSRYARTLARTPHTDMWLDCGTGDGQILRELQALTPVLRSRGLTVHLAERHGGHTFAVWRPALAAALPWILNARTGADTGAGADRGTSVVAGHRHAATPARHLVPKRVRSAGPPQPR